MSKLFSRVKTFANSENAQFMVTESDSVEIEIISIEVQGRTYVITPTHRFGDFTITVIDGHGIKVIPVNELTIEIGTERPKK